MAESEYNAAARKERYERTKQLKGRQPGKGDEPSSGSGPAKAQPPPDRSAARAAAAKRVKALNGKLTQLRDALKAARAKGSADKAPKKSAVESKAEKLKANKDYYEKNKKEIAAKAGSKAKAPSKPEDTKPEARGVEDIEAAIKSTLVELKAAIAKLKTL